jgi:hypothetical protein
MKEMLLSKKRKKEFCTRCKGSSQCKTCMCTKSRYFCNDNCSCNPICCTNRKEFKPNYISFENSQLKGEFIAPDINNFSFKGKPKNIPLNCKTELDFLELFLNKLLIERILEDSKRKQQKKERRATIEKS